MNKPGFLFLFFLLGLNYVIGFRGYLSHARQANDSLRYYHNVIVKPENSAALTSAFLFFEREIQKQLSNGDTLSAIQNLRRVAIGQYVLGFLYESETSAVQALKLLKNQKKNPVTKEARSGILNHLGIVYKQLKVYDKALSYYKAALESAVDLSDSIPTLNNISYIYLDQNKYELALKTSSLVFEKRLKQNDAVGIARALDNLGFVQSKLNLPDALKHMETALKIRRNHNDIPGVYSSHHHLSKYYFDRGNRERSIAHAEQAYELAKQLNSASYIENALSLLLDLSEDPKVLEYKKLTDSIYAAKQIQENKYAAIKYNVEQERLKAQAAQLQNERQKRYKVLFLSAFLLAITGAVFVLYHKNQQRQRELVEAAQKTEDRISKRVHDHLANDVSGVMTFVENKLNIPIKVREKLLNFLSDIYTRARDISVENAGIDVRDFPEALKNLIAQHHPKGVNIITSPYSNINWVAVPEHKKKAIYKSLQELLINTKKHAKACLVTIAFHKKGRKNEMVYSDDGTGFNPDRIVFGGLGNVETRMTEIGGSFSFESSEGKGFKAKLIF